MQSGRALGDPPLHVRHAFHLFLEYSHRVLREQLFRLEQELFSPARSASLLPFFSSRAIYLFFSKRPVYGTSAGQLMGCFPIRFLSIKPLCTSAWCFFETFTAACFLSPVFPFVNHYSFSGGPRGPQEFPICGGSVLDVSPQRVLFLPPSSQD